MRDDFTHIAIVLDKSGSMAKVRNDTIGGLNQFIKEQQQVPGKATLTLVQFSNPDDIRYTHENRDIKEVRELTKDDYYTTGSTALLKAVEDTIDSTGEFLSRLSEDGRPSKVVFVIVTDGEENASNSIFSKKTYTKDDLAKKVKHQRDAYKWEFIFLGANMDAFGEASSMGISKGCTLSYTQTSRGTKALYDTLSHKLVRTRGMGGSAANAMDFTQNERATYTAEANS